MNIYSNLKQNSHEHTLTISSLVYPLLVSGQYLRCVSSDWCSKECPGLTGHSN